MNPSTSDTVKSDEILQTCVIRFENAEHKDYAELCLSYGFVLTLSASMRIGLRFVHPVKGHVVRLDRDDNLGTDELYEPHLLIYTPSRTEIGPFYVLPQNGAPEFPACEDFQTPMYPEHYSDVENAWLSRPMADGGEVTLREFLERELHIWFKVRPHNMNTIPKIG